MGCDIHFHVEVRAMPADPTGAALRRAIIAAPDDQVVRAAYADWRQENPHLAPAAWVRHDWEARYASSTDEGALRLYDYDRLFEDPLFVGRSYDLFAILAGVRNGYGFAGVKTGDGFVPIARPRGLPDDATPAVKAESDGLDGDGHSHSYLSVAELDAYDWTRMTWHRGWVDADNYRAWKERGKPNQWSWGVRSGTTRRLSHARMEAAIAAGRPDQAYTPVKWAEPYHCAAGRFYDVTLPALRRLGPADEVRIVFWFDN
jgi:uncharacterized protein (TIGR02996 family)